MIRRYIVMGLGMLAALAGCQGTETSGEPTPTATSAGLGPSAGAGFDEVIGGGLVGSSAWNRGGAVPDVGDFRNPRLGASGW